MNCYLATVGAQLSNLEKWDVDTKKTIGLLRTRGQGRTWTNINGTHPEEKRVMLMYANKIYTYESKISFYAILKTRHFKIFALTYFQTFSAVKKAKMMSVANVRKNGERVSLANVD